MGRNLGKPLGETLERLMAAYGVSDLKALAKALGANEGTVRNWHKRGSVPLSWLIVAADRTGYDLDWLEGRTGAPIAGRGSGVRPMAPPSQGLGARLVAVRHAYGLNGAEFARRLGISRGYLSDLENGKAAPGRDFVRSLTEVFGVRPDYLLRGVGDMLVAVEMQRALPQLDWSHLPAPGRLPDEKAIARRTEAVQRAFNALFGGDEHEPADRGRPPSAVSRSVAASSLDLPAEAAEAAEPAAPFFEREGLLVNQIGGRPPMGMTSQPDATAPSHGADVALADHPKPAVTEPALHSPAQGGETAQGGEPLMFTARVPGSGSTVEYEVIPKHWGSTQPDEGDPRLGDVAFSVPFMLRRFGGRHGYEMLYMRGDSMEPTLTEEDELIIDTNIRRVDVSGIYAISIGDAIMIQRVQRRLDGSLVVKGDNPRYEPTTLTGSEVTKLNIVGRMVWPRVR